MQRLVAKRQALALALALLPLTTAAALQAPTIPDDGTPPVTTESGLVWSVLASGPEDGAHPRTGDEVRVHYTGWLTDGTVFDDSRAERAPGLGVEPATFRVGQVIPGWNEGLSLMRPGDRYKLVIPPDLAYGATGSGPIPPDATLVFDVELLSFEPGPELPAWRTLSRDALELEGGLRLEVLAASERPAPTGDQLMKLNWVLWTPDGTVLDCSAWAEMPMRCTPAAPPQPLAFLTLAMPYLAQGSAVLLEVPATMFGQGQLPGVGPDQPSYWHFESIYVAYPPEPPPFARVGDAALTLPGGARYSTIRAGEGPALGPDARFEMSFTYWKSDGELIDTTDVPGRGPLATTAENLRIPFLQELSPLLSVGDVVAVEVGAADAFGEDLPPGLTAEDLTVWRVELVSRIEPLAVPEFRLPDAERAQRTDSGLELEVLAEGQGPKPRLDQRARVHYAGWLAADGTPFDNSYERGIPAEFGLTQVIAGWTETLRTMSVGSVVIVRIPWKLAYGASGRPPTIPAQADLVFRVELLGIEE